MENLITIRLNDYELTQILTALNAIHMPKLADKIKHQDSADDGPEIEILLGKVSKS
jgi:hypothetical protein